MNLHICNLNWSKWSPVIDGYSYKIQVRECTVCKKTNHRRVGWAGQASAAQINEAASKIKEG